MTLPVDAGDQAQRAPTHVLRRVGAPGTVMFASTAPRSRASRLLLPTPVVPGGTGGTVGAGSRTAYVYPIPGSPLADEG